MKKSFKAAIILSLWWFALSGCTSNPPLEDYSLARSAIESAKFHEAERRAPTTWFLAEENYRLGQVAYKKDDYKNAKKYFLKARTLAEKSEDKARLGKKVTKEKGE